LQKEFADDLKNDKNPTLKLRNAYLDMEKGQVPHELLAISLTLSKDPSEYSENVFQNIVGNQLGAKQGDPIKYYKTNTKGTAHSDPSFIDNGKYLEMLRSTFENQIKYVGYDFDKDVKGAVNLSEWF